MQIVRFFKAVANFVWPLAFCPKHLPGARDWLHLSACAKVKGEGAECRSSRAQEHTKQPCLKHMLIRTDQRMWCQFIEKQVRQAQVAQDPDYSQKKVRYRVTAPAKSGGQDLHSNTFPRLLSGEFIILAMGENEPSAAQPGKHTCALRSSGASLPCVWELVLLAVPACPCQGTCPCVWLGGRRKCTSLTSAVHY